MTTIVPDVSAETAGPATGGLRVALGIPHERLRSALADWLEQSGRISVVHRQEDGKAAGAAARRSHADVVVLARRRWAKRRSAPLHAVPEALGDIPLMIVGRDGGGRLRAGPPGRRCGRQLVLDMEIDALVDALWRAASRCPHRVD
jgi:DNA-binding NarL/FixJ family response regulator